MATLPLVPNQIEPVFQALTLAMPLQLATNLPDNPQQLPPNPAYGCRIDWQTEGQPSQQYFEDVVYIGCETVDDTYNRIRYPAWLNVGGVPTKISQYARVWKCHWTVEGPNSFDNARIIHSYLMTDEATQFSLQASGLWFIPNSAAPLRLPYYEDGHWWERADFYARFYELVTEQYTSGLITSAEVVVQNPQGVLADIEIKGA